MPEKQTTLAYELGEKLYKRRSSNASAQVRRAAPWTDQSMESAIPFRLEYIAMSTHRKGWSYEHGASQLSVIEIPLAGSLYIDYNSRELRVQPGFACLLPSGEYNRLHMKDSVSMKKVTFAFSGSCSSLILNSLTRNTVLFPVEHPEIIMEYYKIFHPLLQESNVRKLPELTGLAMEFVMKLTSSCRKSEKLPEIMTSVFNIMSAGIGERKLTTTEIADMMHLSAYHLNQMFKQYYGRSVSRQLERMRMIKACQLLLYENCSVKETAARLGYANAFVFSAAFRKYSGIPPSAYRKKAKPCGFEKAGPEIS
ncbi:MAG: helix-turn-helix transcriptional regulator [Lentisphaeria bacterium]|nr:helix-turn-helix transcriptional regulator [Lentisphaeria bacterium]